MIRRISIILNLFLVCLSSCSSFEVKYQPTIEARVSTGISVGVKTQIVTYAKVPTNTPYPTYTTFPTYTPCPTYSPESEIVAQASTTEQISSIISNETDVGQNSIAKNFVAKKSDNNVEVEIFRILIAQKDGYEFPPWLLEGSITLVKYFFRITNNYTETIHFNFSSTITAVNGEQIYFDDYIGNKNLWTGDDLDRHILAGSTVVAILWTGIKRSSWDEINRIIISIPHAYSSNNIPVTDEFLFDIDVINWGNEPIPNEWYDFFK